MEKKYNLTFYKSELAQYNYILKDTDIRYKVSNFLLKYVSVEAFYKKLLIAEKEKNGNKLSKKTKHNLPVKANEVKKVLEYYDIDFEDELIERIFGSNDRNYMECSIKKLRDRMVHRVNDNVLRIILERYESINKDLDDFISLFSTNYQSNN